MWYDYLDRWQFEEVARLGHNHELVFVRGRLEAGEPRRTRL